jgi:hypothetical protein
VADKGYHSNETMRDLAAADIRSYASERQRGRPRWRDGLARAAVLANHRRIHRRRGWALQKRRAEYTERSSAHSLESGGLRRIHLRGLEKIDKRMGIHLAAHNLGRLMRRRFGMSTPRSLQGRRGGLFPLHAAPWRWLQRLRLPATRSRPRPAHRPRTTRHGGCSHDPCPRRWVRQRDSADRYRPRRYPATALAGPGSELTRSGLDRTPWDLYYLGDDRIWAHAQ